MSTETNQIISKLQQLGNSDIAAHSQRFFKTGKGDYGEGDIFLGIRVPTIRKCVKEYRKISLEDTIEVLKSPFHEARLLALLILVAKYCSTNISADKEVIYNHYLGHTKFINNWDLVDCSAEHIVGAHLFSKDRKPIYMLVLSKNLWERRIGVISTFHFIKRDDFTDILAIAKMLLHDKEDLIHKAVGWMLRETGKRSPKSEKRFLTKYYRKMPRTMLRYAIEKLPETERLEYLHGTK
ncbi:MAG: DNA alkylation repair protein [Desulfobacterium sp.]|nr:DNA alkylation repair protein [Desulfobacterium sp.]MBU3950324.1 DNA alkylation repair protein [Pseudomonadota bacterium]MBU4011734.1 DNA alkylation repair protein [Pseudomonadota bacterium]MBU4036169.1 DNA alkylation repair protein [Pseudomonadota bacterium]